MKHTQRLPLNWKYHSCPWPRGLVSTIVGGGGGGGCPILINVFQFSIFSATWYFINKYFPNQTFSLFSQVNLGLHIYAITKLLLLTTHSFADGWMIFESCQISSLSEDFWSSYTIHTCQLSTNPSQEISLGPLLGLLSRRFVRFQSWPPGVRLDYQFRSGPLYSTGFGKLITIQIWIRNNFNFM